MKTLSKNKVEIFKSAWDLSFKDREVELAFQKMKIGYQNKVSLLSFSFLLFVSMLIWLQEADLKNVRITIFNTLKLPCLLFYFWLSKKYNNKIELISILIFLPIFLLVLENQVNFPFRSEAYNLIFRTYWNGCYNEVFTVIWIFLKVSWRKILIIIGIINLYTSLRYFDFETSISTNMKPLQMSIYNLIFHTLFSYIIEKTDRTFYFDIKKNEISLSIFHNFIQKSLPLGIIVANHKEILFSNKESSNLLKTDGENLNINDMKEFELEQMNNEISPIVPEQFSPVSIYNFLQHSFKTVKQAKDILYSAKRVLGQKASNHKKFLVRFNSIIWENEFAFILVLSEDINAVKLQYLKEFELFKDRVLASISHQFRTPLNGLMGILENIEENTSDILLRDSIGTAMNSSKRLLSVINDILDFTQINTGRFTPNISQFSIDILLKEIHQAFESESKKKNVKFIIENKSSEIFRPLTNKNRFNSDKQRLKQIICNILSNAFKYTTNGFVKLTYYLYSKYEGNNDLNINFTVEDSGCGIKENMLTSLFELFGKIREGDYKNINTDGIGFGLAISQKLINALNQDPDDLPFTVSSVVGKGSIFSFEIKSRTFENPQSKESHDFQMINEKNHWDNSPKALTSFNLPTFCFETNVDHILIPKSKKKILAVDDDPINIMVISNYLKNIPEVNFETASNGLEALQKIEEKAYAENFFDLILMDCNMPFMDGFEATERIIKLIDQKTIPDTPVIAVTANILPSDLERCLKCGMVDYITKPFSKLQLLDKLNKHHILTDDSH